MWQSGKVGSPSIMNQSLGGRGGSIGGGSVTGDGGGGEESERRRSGVSGTAG